MAYNKARPTIKFETPAEFFKNIRIPQGWQLIGRNDIIKGGEWDSFGFVYRTAEDTVIRLCAFGGKGGIAEKNTETSEYKCLLGNHLSEEINQFLEQ